ncbi:hypothetical protein GOODEAATRI_028635 [Goodea atripinnis]|uniref:Uncharacterized protein n=1 Tax=Goodea atripinnis TaxID=208336 RepID=A0ABV0P222_9TELE
MFSASPTWLVANNISYSFLLAETFYSSIKAIFWSVRLTVALSTHSPACAVDFCSSSGLTIGCFSKQCFPCLPVSSSGQIRSLCSQEELESIAGISGFPYWTCCPCDPKSDHPKTIDGSRHFVALDFIKADLGKGGKYKCTPHFWCFKTMHQFSSTSQ